MRLANRALIAALATLVLCAVVSAQAVRSDRDPRNQAPTVGTGGPEGGPTGLFTIYDGATIRRGEFTFSIAYSNYDRDPGNVDITDIPLSFNVGLNDHVELFFKTNGYARDQGQQLHRIYQVFTFRIPSLSSVLACCCTGPAIISAPVRVTGSLTLRRFSRCSGRQALRVTQAVSRSGSFRSLAPLVPRSMWHRRLRIAVYQCSGRAIWRQWKFRRRVKLSGHRFSSRQYPSGYCALNANDSTESYFRYLSVVPDLFTIAPAYLPDAPFVNRLYGESSFTNMVAGAKIRLTGPNDAFGFGFVPFYRWYLDKANDFSGFNQMQRGAGPGADIGDFGLVMFADGRLSEHVNVSANLGYILNSNPKSEAMGDAVLLDRPDEFLAGVGFDFPVNKHFQAIGEVRSTMYVGGRTPNAFPNNPVEAIGGVRIFPARWWGIGAAYRRHLNQQDGSHFENGLPNAFRPSDDPNGFMFQFWAGHRNARGLPPPPNVAPTVSVSASMATITLPCPPGNKL